MFTNNLGVIIFTCNRPLDLRRCLDSVFSQSYSNFDILVVDNGECEATDKILQDKRIRVVKDKIKRLSYLFNLGWKSVNSELIAYLADDAELESDWVEQGLAAFSRHPEAGVVTGPFVSPYEFTGEMHALYSQANKNIFLRIFSRFYDNFILEGKTFEPGMFCESGSYTLGQGFKPDFSKDKEIDLATSSAMMIKRFAIEQIKGFDENFLFNHADGDLFIRLKKQGFKIIYNPKMCAIHYIRIGPSRYPFFIGRDTAYFYLKDVHPKSVRGFFAAVANVMILNCYWVYKAIQCRDFKQLKGIMGFFKGISDYIFRRR